MRTIRFCAGAFLILALCTSVAVAAPTVNDFEGGGTAFTASANKAPVPVIDAGVGNPGSSLKIGFSGVGTHLTEAAFDRTHVGAFSKITADFDFLFTAPDFGGADGFSFSLANTATYGTSGAAQGGSNTGEHPSLVGSVGFEFDTFNNGGVDPNANHTGIWFSGAHIDSEDLAPLVLESGLWTSVHIEITPTVGGSNVDMRVQNSLHTVTPYSGFFVPGLLPYESRVVFQHRTGSASENTYIDNLNVRYAAPARIIPLPSAAAAGAALLGLLGARRLLRGRRPSA